MRTDIALRKHTYDSLLIYLFMVYDFIFIISYLLPPPCKHSVL
jgi:hypothetical protein